MCRVTVNFVVVVLIASINTFAISTAKILTEIVQTNKGPVQGEILTAVQNPSLKYSAFKGIPYAKPPLGNLRFKPPVEINSWTKPLITTSDPNSCPQYEHSVYSGDEDCLYLNVYTPKTSFSSKSSELLSVMVWIHGGAFSVGNNTCGADFLIEDNVVIVSMNYRLGALGFLSLDHPKATGNAGLKDQVLALKWIQQNIRNFGGDPAKVTIFGQSAGGVAVELHKISNLSKGLFKTSIAMSGSALNYWAIASTKDAVSRAFRLASNLGISTARTDELLEKLYKTSARDLVLAAINISSESLTKVPFTPTYENTEIAEGQVFLTSCVISAYKSGKFNQEPHMLGFTDSETIFFGVSDESKVNQSFGALQGIFDKIIHAFSGQIVSVTTDLLFVLGIDRTQQYLSKGTAAIYYYRNKFDYDSSLHKVAGVNLNGTGHEDDLAHIFWKPNKNQSLDPKSDIAVHRKKMVRMWTNFAKYGNPTPVGTKDTLLNVNWTPSGTDGQHLEIGNTNYLMKSRPTDAIVKMAQGLTYFLESALNGCA